MRHSPWNVVFHELRGLEVYVVFHPDPTLRGLVGVIEDETTNTLIVRTSQGRRVRILKSGSILLIKLPNGPWVEVRGDEIKGDPVERLKRLEKVRGLRRLVREGKKRRHPGPQAPGEGV